MNTYFSKQAARATSSAGGLSLASGRSIELFARQQEGLGPADCKVAASERVL